MSTGQQSQSQHQLSVQCSPEAEQAARRIAPAVEQQFAAHAQANPSKTGASPLAGVGPGTLLNIGALIIQELIAVYPQIQQILSGGTAGAKPPRA